MIRWFQTTNPATSAITATATFPSGYMPVNLGFPSGTLGCGALPCTSNRFVGLKRPCTSSSALALMTGVGTCDWTFFTVGPLTGQPQGNGINVGSWSTTWVQLYALVGSPMICPVGFFCPTGSAHPLNCSLYCTECGSASSSSCTRCLPGFVLAFPNGCVPKCTLGMTRTDICVYSFCFVCGKFCSDQCCSGSYNHSVSNTCTLCPVGSYCPIGANAFVNCPVGSFNNLQGQSACQLCTAGTASNNMQATTANTCAPCVSGTYSLGPGASSCTVCARGQFCSANSTQPCPTGMLYIVSIFFCFSMQIYHRVCQAFTFYIIFYFDSRLQVPLPLRGRHLALTAQQEIIARPQACLRPRCVRRAPSVGRVPFHPLLVHLVISVLLGRRSLCHVQLANSLTSRPLTFANHVPLAFTAQTSP